MTSKIFALATMVATGIIVADLVLHPKGTSAVLNGLNKLTKTSGNQMLGYKA